MVTAIDSIVSVCDRFTLNVICPLGISLDCKLNIEQNTALAMILDMKKAQWISW